MAENSSRAIFNLYETTPPAPGFKTFLEGVLHTFAFVEKEPSFIVGQLHKNLDAEGLFKFAHFAGFQDGSFQGFGPNPSQEWQTAIREGHGEWGHQIRHPGGFQEIATWSGEAWSPKTQAAENSIFLLAVFKDVPSDFEEEWKTKSGATLLSAAVPSSAATFHQAGLFRKLGGPTPFRYDVVHYGDLGYRYILRCELLPVDSAPSSGVTEVLASLPDIRTKLSEADVPVVNISAYEIVYVTKPQPKTP